MDGKEVKHGLISDESARKATFEEKKADLLRELEELTTLYGVTGCAIIFNADGSSPDVWPSHSEALSVLEQFRNLPPEEQCEYMLDQESFLVRDISWLSDKLEKEKKKNKMIEQQLFLAKCITAKNMQFPNSLKNMNDMSDLLKENPGSTTDKIDQAKDENEEE